jgi:hypothetical protein
MSAKNNVKGLMGPWFSVAGAIIIAISFFLPWLQVKCSGKTITGSGFIFAQDEPLLYLILGCALLIILFFILFRKGLALIWFRIGAIFAAGLGLFMMIMTYISIEQKLSGFIVKRLTSHQIKPGLLGTIIGFLIVIISALLSRKKTGEQ